MAFGSLHAGETGAERLLQSLEVAEADAEGNVSQMSLGDNLRLTGKAGIDDRSNPVATPERWQRSVLAVDKDLIQLRLGRES